MYKTNGFSKKPLHVAEVVSQASTFLPKYLKIMIFNFLFHCKN